MALRLIKSSGALLGNFKLLRHGLAPRQSFKNLAQPLLTFPAQLCFSDYSAQRQDIKSTSLRCYSSTSKETFAGTPSVTQDTVDVAVYVGLSDFRLTDNAAAELELDARQLLHQVQARGLATRGPFELSLVLCDNAHIANLNQDHRNKPGPTDVLSFESESPPGYPICVLGDIVISLETAQQQASERGHSLREELRVLLVHGVLHLLGHDHERGPEEAKQMAAQEGELLTSLGWQGTGLIESSGIQEPDLHAGSQISSQASTSTSESAPAAGKRRREPGNGIRLLALDMDGTLLNSESQVLPSSVEALKAALQKGVVVCLATGKARPAAMTAMARVGLAGEGLVMSSTGPGLFLQGLAVHGKEGSLLEGPDLPASVVEAAFKYAQEQSLPLAAFLGDDCATLQMHPELEELHHRYYEPLCQTAKSLEALLQGPPVKKLLFMTDADAIASKLQPYWAAAVQGRGAETMMAVPNMLEIVPVGINKWVGMQLLLKDLGLSPAELMSCGDGSNDLLLVANSGLGIAMGNAVPKVKEAAQAVVASNDDHGIAEAIERYLL